jgi:hypothetical protein
MVCSHTIPFQGNTVGEPALDAYKYAGRNTRGEMAVMKKRMSLSSARPPDYYGADHRRRFKEDRASGVGHAHRQTYHGDSASWL